MPMWFLYLNISVIIEILVSILGFAIIRRQNLVTASWRFAGYVLMVLMGSYFGTRFTGIVTNLGDGGFAFVFLNAAVLSFYIFLLSKGMFALKRWEAVFMGILLGAFANPFSFPMILIAFIVGGGT